jgi:hypothetical protein
MTSEYVREPVQLLLSVAVTTMLLNVPVSVGVPDNVAVPGLNDRPVGNVPVKLKLTVPIPPECVKIWLYAVPAVPADSDAGFTVMVWQLI